MQTATIEQLQTSFSDILKKLADGDDVLIMRDGIPVAKLVQPPHEFPRPTFGSAKGTLISYVDDDEHLKDFEEYMP